jgi:DNA-binding PadR family transcriptional regulator
VLARILDSINIEFQLAGKIVVTITDSGSNFLKAFRIFGPELESEQDDEELIEISGILKETEVEDEDDTVSNFI